MARRSNDDDGFGAFFRRYTKTWVHAVATAALTGFGILTFVHRGFAVLAVAAYVAPPAVLYLRDPSSVDARDASPPDGSSTDPDSIADDQAAANPERAPRSDGTVTDPSEFGGDDDAAPADGPWTPITVPTDETLHAVAVADGSAYAVGADGGLFVGETGAEAWSAVLDDGPGADSNALRGVDAAGAAAGNGGIWFAGEGGALGRLDPESNRHVNHSAPDGDTNSITDVAAASDGATEVVLLADGSGRVRRGQFHDGVVAWDAPVTPGSGASLVGVATVDASTAYACDSNQSVFRTDDGGRSFERIGVDGAAGTLTDVATATTAAGEECVASADDGVVHRYDGTNWTPDAIGDESILGIAAVHRGWLACADDGVVFERIGGGSDWHRVATPVTGALHGCDLGEAAAIAVGDAGTVVGRGSGSGTPGDR